MDTIDRPEQPALNLKKASICFHFVEYKTPRKPLNGKYQYCPAVGSMELDLLSYGFQIKPPLNTQSSISSRTPLDIIFPKKLEYYSEGRTMKLSCNNNVRKAEFVISKTSFLRSGMQIWHLVLTPPKDLTFNEFDIIKLIHLYDGRTEQTEMIEKIGFRLPDGNLLDVNGFLKSQIGLDEKDFKIKGGTIEILTKEQKNNNVYHTQVLNTILLARQDGGETYHRKLIEWLQNDTPEKKVIIAYCGIVTGIFDFDQIDPEEVLDTLEPTFADNTTFLRNHRCTLTCIVEEDRAMKECWEDVGISPYLLIPHSTILHNEALVECADTILGNIQLDKRLGLLEKAYEKSHMNLNNLFLPNVFNYITERTLFSKSSSGRGLNDRLILTKNKLGELKERINLRWELRRDRGQMAVTIFLATISLWQMKDIFFSMLENVVSPEVGWRLFGGLNIFTILIIWILWSLGLRKK